MVSHVVPYFQNDRGYKCIEISVRGFVCIGASPPFDHPHIFLDMGVKRERICPYCSTLYVFNSAMDGVESKPSGCRYFFRPFLKKEA
ncbi:MAG: Conserved zinc-finger domain-containing protein [Candidatus Tokpelaia sp. JSC188]|nr:MAG: Conserved zinc-finger domain-containing protein [Candidatus Tokpelaia sp. JSC188]